MPCADTRHFEHSGEYEGALTLSELRQRKAEKRAAYSMGSRHDKHETRTHNIVPNAITLRAKELSRNRPYLSFASAYAEALASLLNESAWPDSPVPHQWERNRNGSNFKDWTLTNKAIGPWNRTALPKDRTRLHKKDSTALDVAFEPDAISRSRLHSIERQRNRSAALKTKAILVGKPVHSSGANGSEPRRRMQKRNASALRNANVPKNASVLRKHVNLTARAQRRRRHQLDQSAAKSLQPQVLDAEGRERPVDEFSASWWKPGEATVERARKRHEKEEAEKARQLAAKKQIAELPFWQIQHTHYAQARQQLEAGAVPAQ